MFLYRHSLMVTNALLESAATPFLWRGVIVRFHSVSYLQGPYGILTHLTCKVGFGALVRGGSEHRFGVAILN